MSRWRNKTNSVQSINTGGEVVDSSSTSECFHNLTLEPAEWQRPAAFMIDLIVLAAIVYIGKYAWNKAAVEVLSFGLYPFKSIFFIMGFCYFWIQDSYKGTVGKQWVGLEVIDIDGKAIGLGGGLIRTLAFIFTSLFNAHDSISHSYVIKKQ